ncbi:efflux RND transporter periplasmic adaptor subunit [Aurantimonas sp. VKM B-3413]|uniref:efflux RND transporter periplasmic adaptor subunit n=1 Tax=Aurantimonas sp. VKM B-3413 TaxID=2779401 RepID=UPI001E30AE56|nr:efflux RND transporter periplasmic adaptor subunit [Aurantimonas sp. VKM B-3413]MCB8839116.1 efflux RND transporter periplasmic adaptor subunit [Aurantimonas sp. VKM B-3413]
MPFRLSSERPRRLFVPLAVCVCGLLSACSQQETPPAPPEPVAYVTAEPQSYGRTIALTGEIVARYTSTYAFKTSGRVTKVAVDVGDHVEPGTVLAEIDPTQQQADVAAANASVDSAKAQVSQASAAFERQKQLLAKGFTTRSEYDQAEKALSAASSALDTAQADLTTARTNLSDTVLKADASGVITSRSVDEGQMVSAAQAAFGFARSGAKDAVFQIQEQLLIGSKKPESIKVALVSDPSVTAIGHVREVSPLIDTSTGTVQVKLGLDNPPDEMTLGSAVVGRDVRQAAKDAIFLPWNALMVKNGKPAAWVVGQDGKATLKPIEVEAYQTARILVRDGIEPGDRVVTDGSQLVRPGQAVDLVPAKSEAR